MKSIRFRLLFFFILVGLFSGLAAGGNLIFRTYNYLITSIEADLNRAVTTVVPFLDHPEILRSVDPQVSFDESFIKNVKVFRAVRSALGLTYFYTLVPNEEGQFVFAIDANDTWEWDGQIRS